MRSATDLILLGRFGAAHGVRGEVRLQSYTEDPVTIATYGPLTDASGARRIALLSVRPQGKDMLVARVDGVTDRAGAEALSGVALYVARDQLPQPDEDEFYLADLIGLRAETRAGALIGHVVAVRNFGAGDILEVAPATQGAQQAPDVSDEGTRRRDGDDTLMFPFTKNVVPMIDLPGGRIVIEPQPEATEETE